MVLVLLEGDVKGEGVALPVKTENAGDNPRTFGGCSGGTKGGGIGDGE